MGGIREGQRVGSHMPARWYLYPNSRSTSRTPCCNRIGDAYFVSMLTALTSGRRRRPPSPPARYPGHFLVTLAKNKLQLFVEMATAGDVSAIRVGPQPLVLVTDPELIQQVLVTDQKSFTKGRALERTKLLLGNGLLTSEGSFHLRQRRLAQPAFHKQRIHGYSVVMGDESAKVRDSWRNGATLDIHEEMMRLTLTIAGKTLFDADVKGDAHVVDEAMELSLKMFQYTVLPMGAALEYIPIGWIGRLHRARARMDELIYKMIEDRRRSGTDRGDLLSMLVAARDSEGDHSGMTDEQLRDEIVTLLMAGHETTAVAMSWTWYLLSQHPDVERTLHEEVDRVLGGRTPTSDDMMRLPYTRQVIAESMRLYPPAWIVERKAVHEVELGGYRIKPGTLVYASQYLMHRDPRWWNEPERFDPSRWAPDAPGAAERPKFAYFPFGAGTRICIGEQFAWMEAILALATLAQRWSMRHDPTHKVELEPLVTLRPKYGMRMTLVER